MYCDIQSSHGQKQVLASPWGKAGGKWGVGAFRLTWWAEEAHSVIGAVLARSLLPVEAPEALTGTAMDHLASAACRYPVSGPGLQAQGPGTHTVPIVEMNGIQPLIVALPTWVVNVEPLCPFAKT